MRVRNDNAHVETAKGVLFLKDFKIAGLDRERLKLVLKSPAREFHMAQVDVSDAGAVASIADRDKESFLCAPSPCLFGRSPGLSVAGWDRMLLAVLRGLLKVSSQPSLVSREEDEGGATEEQLLPAKTPEPTDTRQRLRTETALKEQAVAEALEAHAVAEYCEQEEEATQAEIRDVRRAMQRRRGDEATLAASAAQIAATRFGRRKSEEV